MLVHTEVPDELEGHGIGGVLVRTAIDSRPRENLVVVPRCPFAAPLAPSAIPRSRELVEIEWPPLGARSDP